VLKEEEKLNLPAKDETRPQKTMVQAATIEEAKGEDEVQVKKTRT